MSRGTNYRRDAGAVLDRIQQRVHERADREARAGIFCLCNHSAAEHDLAPDTATNKARAACVRCPCTVFQRDPTL